MSIKKAPKRAAARSNPPLSQLCNRLNQSQVGLFGNHSQYFGRKLFQRRNASTTRLRRHTLALMPALQPLYRRRHAHRETFGRLTPRRARFHRLDNVFPQVTRIGLRHR